MKFRLIILFAIEEPSKNQSKLKTNRLNLINPFRFKVSLASFSNTINLKKREREHFHWIKEIRKMWLETLALSQSSLWKRALTESYAINENDRFNILLKRLIFGDDKPTKLSF